MEREVGSICYLKIVLRDKPGRQLAECLESKEFLDRVEHAKTLLRRVNKLQKDFYVKVYDEGVYYDDMEAENG